MKSNGCGKNLSSLTWFMPVHKFKYFELCINPSSLALLFGRIPGGNLLWIIDVIKFKKRKNFHLLNFLYKLKNLNQFEGTKFLPRLFNIMSQMDYPKRKPIHHQHSISFLQRIECSIPCKNIPWNILKIISLPIIRE